MSLLSTVVRRPLFLFLLLAGSLWLTVAGCNWGDGGSPAGDAGPSDTVTEVDSEADGSGDAETDDEIPVGDPCQAPNDCASGASCIGNPQADYTCMAHCKEVWSMCEGGSVCTPVANGEPICYTGGTNEEGTKCQSNLDCMSGLLCVGIRDEPHYCVEACHVESDGCGGEEYCKAFGESGKGYCRSKVGAPCSEDSDCDGQLGCSSELGPGVRGQFPSNYCTDTPCDDDSDCPGDAKCREYPDTNTRLCFAACEGRSDCRLAGNYVCLDADACSRSGGKKECNEFRDGARLCVPPPLRDWTS